MEINNIYDLQNKDYWVNEMKKSDWDAGLWLASLTDENKTEETFGDGTLVLILTENDKLLSYCTFAPQDEIDDLSMQPWIGFVYTYPEHRGHRYAGLLIEKCKELARQQGRKEIFVSSEEKGLYEKYGFTQIDERMSVHGYMTGIFKCNL